MRHDCGFRDVVLTLAIVAAAAPAAGQSSVARGSRAGTPPAKASALPGTPDGRPDLQGTWDFAQLTPLERPGEFAGKKTITEEEAEEFAQHRIETTHKDRRDGGAAVDVERAYNDFWWDFGTRIAAQPSLVVDPSDGRIPPLTPAAQERIATRRNHRDNPEERALAERCSPGLNSAPPIAPRASHSTAQLVQTTTH